MDEKLKYKIQSWIVQIGYSEAEKRLMLAGLSGSTISKLLAGRYPNQPKAETMLMISNAMKKSA